MTRPVRAWKMCRIREYLTVPDAPRSDLHNYLRVPDFVVSSTREIGVCISGIRHVTLISRCGGKVNRVPAHRL